MTGKHLQRVLKPPILGLGGICLVAFVAIFVTAARTAQAGPPAGYTLAWSDEFNGAVGSSPSSANWNFDTGAGGWGNGELETYVTDTAHAGIISDPAATDGLALQITATDDNGGIGTAGQYHSARLRSDGKVTPTYGYIEIRAKAPTAPGTWPAVWMLGTDNPTDSWPTCGEQDILEMFGKAPGTNSTSWHMSYLGGGVDWTGQYTLPGGASFSDAYHTFAILWTQQELTAYVDGNAFESHGAGDSPGWIFNHPFYFLMNLAIGGGPPGPPTAATPFPEHLDVDYIRVYTAPGESPGYGTVHDPCDNFAVAYNTSGNWVIDNSNPAFFNGDTGRMSRVHNAVEFVNYKYANITGGSVQVGTNTTDNTAVTLWYSTNNGASYTQASTTNGAITATSGGWGVYTVSTNGTLPNSVTDLEIQEAPTVNSWDHQLMDVTITSNSPVATPPCPSGLTATAGPSSVTLNWTATSDATSYDIYRSTTAYAEFGAPPTITGVTTNSYTDNGLTAGTTYYYVVSAVDSAGTSLQSSQAQATAATGGGSCAASPSAPTGLSASGTTSTSTNLSWTADSPPANCTISTYTVFQNGVSIGTTSGTTFGVTGLSPSTTYTFTVSATDQFGNSAQSAGLNVTTAAASCSASPAAPTGLSASNTTTTGTTLSWSAVTPPANCSVSSYTVFQNGTSIGTSTSTSFAVTGLSPSTTYTFTVAATDAFGTGSQSGGLNVTTLAPSCSASPSAPTGLSSSNTTSTGTTLSWSAVTPPANCSITSYTIFKNGTSIGTSTSTSFAVTGLSASTTYTFTVAASDSFGSSAQSAGLNVTTLAASQSISINCGGVAASPFVADTDFTGGTTSSTTHAVTTTNLTAPIPPQTVLQTNRHGAMTYTIGGYTAGSSHTVTLYFEEHYWTATGKRKFNVSINGTSVLSNFDIFATAGGQYIAIQKTFSTTANSSGQIVIAFTNVVDNAMCNGITVN